MNSGSPEHDSHTVESADHQDEDDIEDIVATPASPPRARSFLHIVTEGINIDSRSIFNKIDAEYMAPIFGSSAEASLKSINLTIYECMS